MLVVETCLYKSPSCSLADEEIAHTPGKQVVHRVYTAATKVAYEPKLASYPLPSKTSETCSLEWKQLMLVVETCLYKSPSCSLADEEIAHTPGEQVVHRVYTAVTKWGMNLS